MSILNSINENSNKAIDRSERYINASVKYYKLKLFYLLTTSFSLFIKIIFIGSVSLLGLVFLAFSGANLISEWLNNIVLGYLIMAFILFGISLIIYLSRKQKEKIIIKKIAINYFEE